MKKPEDVQPYTDEDKAKIAAFETEIDKLLVDGNGRAAIRISAADRTALNQVALKYRDAGWHIKLEDRSMKEKDKDNWQWLHIVHPSLTEAIIRPTG